MRRIDIFFILSKTDAENRAHLKVRLILRVRRLCKGGDSYKPILVAKRDVRAYEDIPDFFFVPPILENKFV